MSHYLISGEEFRRLHDVFFRYFSQQKTSQDVANELIDLAEKYKTYAADYDYGRKRFVFVFAVNSEAKSQGLAGFIVYDKSSRKILYGMYRFAPYNLYTSDVDYFINLEPLSLILRTAIDERFDVIESLFLYHHKDPKSFNVFLPFLGFAYRFLGDYFLDYLYENYIDVIERLNNRRIIYGENFVYIPLIGVGLIRRGDGSVFVYEAPRSYLSFPEEILSYRKVSSSEYPLIHRIFSGLIDSAKELDRSMVVERGRCDRYECYYLILSSASPPSLSGRSAFLLTGIQRKGLYGEFLENIDIYFINCNGSCSMYPVSEAMKNVMGWSRSYEKISMNEFLSKYGYGGHYLKILEYIMENRKKFPPKFVEEANKQYQGNVMYTS
jgi:hypothetical protein